MNSVRTDEITRFIEQNGGDLWGEIKEYPKEWWMDEIQSAYTILGYWEWCWVKIDQIESSDLG